MDNDPLGLLQQKQNDDPLGLLAQNDDPLGLLASKSNEGGKGPSGDMLGGVSEVAAKFGSNIAGQAIGGLAGIGTGVGNYLGLTDKNPAQVSENITRAMTYDPRTDYGKSLSVGADAAMGKIQEGINAAGEYVYDPRKWTELLTQGQIQARDLPTPKPEDFNPKAATALTTALNFTPLPFIKGKARGEMEPVAQDSAGWADSNYVPLGIPRVFNRPVDVVTENAYAEPPRTVDQFIDQTQRPIDMVNRPAVEPTGPIGRFFQDFTDSLRSQKDLSDNLYTLEKSGSADRVRVSQLTDSIKDDPRVTPETLEKFTHYDEDPSIKLSPDEQGLYDQIIKPLKDKTEELYKQIKEDGYPIENYTPRKVANRGGIIDRMIDNVQSVGKGNILSRSAGAVKGRTMMALEDADGVRQVVSIKGKSVTAFNDKQATPMGKLDMKTNDQLLDQELAPIKNQIGTLEKERSILTATKGRSEASPGRIANIDQKLGELQKSKEDVLSRYNPNELDNKVFVDKNGKTWSVKQATIKEIEQNTHLTYHKNSLVNYAMNYMELNRAARAIKFLDAYKSSPEFAKVAVKMGTANQPKGWNTTDLPSFRGYYLEPRIADTLNQMARKMKTDDPVKILTASNKFLRTAIFFNPLIHIPNITVHWLTEKGLSSFVNPLAYPRLLRTGWKAAKAVFTQNADYLHALDKGTALLYSDVVNKDLHKVLLSKMGKEFETNPKLGPIAKALGYVNPLNLVKAIYSFSEHATWAVNDIATLQSTYARMERNNLSFAHAMREVEKHIPNYRIPPRVLNSTTLTHFMENPNLSMFGAYHYGALRSYGEMMKSALGKAPVAERARAMDQLALIGLISTVLYPILDQLAKSSTGNQDAHFRRAGSTTLPSNIYKFSTGQIKLQQFIESIVTPAPATKELLQQATNKDFFTGRDIRNKSPIAESAAHAARSFAPIQQADKINKNPGNAAANLLGISTPKKHHK